jgi:hypothetical protein
MYSRVYIYICMPVFCQTYPNLCVKPKFFETKTLAFAAWSSIFPGQAVNYCFFWCKRNFVLGRVKTLHVSWDPLPQDASAPGGLDLWSMSFGPSDPGAPAGLEIYGRLTGRFVGNLIMDWGNFDSVSWLADHFIVCRTLRVRSRLAALAVRSLSFRPPRAAPFTAVFTRSSNGELSSPLWNQVVHPQQTQLLWLYMIVSKDSV